MVKCSKYLTLILNKQLVISNKTTYRGLHVHVPVGRSHFLKFCQFLQNLAHPFQLDESNKELKEFLKSDVRFSCYAKNLMPFKHPFFSHFGAKCGKSIFFSFSLKISLFILNLKPSKCFYSDSSQVKPTCKREMQAQ